MLQLRLCPTKARWERIFHDQETGKLQNSHRKLKAEVNSDLDGHGVEDMRNGAHQRVEAHRQQAHDQWVSTSKPTRDMTVSTLLTCITSKPFPVNASMVSWNKTSTKLVNSGYLQAKQHKRVTSTPFHFL